MGFKTFIRDNIVAKSKLLARLCLSFYNFKTEIKNGSFESFGHLVDTGNKKRFFIDLTHISEGKHWTGIPRFIAYMFLEWYKNPPNGYEVIPVMRIDSKYCRVDVNNIEYTILNILPLSATDDIEYSVGDIYYSGEDFLTMPLLREKKLFRSLRANGVKIYLTNHNNCYESYMPSNAIREISLANSVNAAISETDGIIAVSQWSADGFINRAKAEYISNQYFHIGSTVCLGSDLKCAKVYSDHQTHNSTTKIYRFIMVGTLRLHKGMPQAVAAFEKLWKLGIEAELILVGKKDNMDPTSNDVYSQIINSPELGKRLFFYEGIPDEDLYNAYKNSSAIICGSWYDNHNMPMIEAAQFGLPIIARNFPVFREIAGEHAFYFDGKEPEDLANAVKEWMKLDAEGKAPSSKGIKLYTWAECVKEWEKMIFGDEWYQVGI